MKKKTPFLDFYKDCLSNGTIKHRVRSEYEGVFGGLCSCDVTTDNNKVFNEVTEDAPSGYWGFTGREIFAETYTNRGDEIVKRNAEKIKYDFTPLRQTIILFCAAINDEL